MTCETSGTTHAIGDILGQWDYNFDERGRILVPEPFRSFLSGELVITRGPSRLNVYPKPVWEALRNLFMRDDLMDELRPDRMLMQHVYGACTFATVDSQHRLHVPWPFRSWLNLPEKGAAIVVGAGRRMEIWTVSQLNAWGAANITDAAFGLALAEVGERATPTHANEAVVHADIS